MSKSCVDNEADTVFMTEALARRYPEVFWPAKINLEARGISVRVVMKTQNIWIRDYFPIQVNGSYVRFQYSFGSKKREKYPQLNVGNEPWSGLVCPVRESDIVLDGGNIVQGCGKAILTDKVVEENGPEVIRRLENLLGMEIVIIPAEPGDSLGHADGICKIVDEKTVLINDYASIFHKDKRFSNYADKLRQALELCGFNVELFPYAYGEWPWEMTEKQFRAAFPEADDYNPGFGYYINYLAVKGLVLMPAMKLPKDAAVLAALKRWYPGQDVVAIDCSRLSMEGGLLHCVTASYANKEDSENVQRP